MRVCMIIKRQKFTTSLLCPNQGTDRQKKVLSSRHLRIDRNCKSETPVYMILLPQRARSCHLSHCIVNFEICNSICKSKHLKGQLWPRLRDEKWALSHSVSWRSVVTPPTWRKIITFSSCVMKVSCDPAWVTKNDHFLILCHEGQLWPHVGKEKWSLSHFVGPRVCHSTFFGSKECHWASV